MKILLDECVDPRCKQFFGATHEVTHVKDQGWLGKKNGELVAFANEKFDVLFTKDTNMVHQTSLKGLTLAVAYTGSHPKSLEDYRTPVAEFEQAAHRIQPGTYADVRQISEQLEAEYEKDANVTERELRQEAREEYLEPDDDGFDL